MGKNRRVKDKTTYFAACRKACLKAKKGNLPVSILMLMILSSAVGCGQISLTHQGVALSENSIEKENAMDEEGDFEKNLTWIDPSNAIDARPFLELTDFKADIQSLSEACDNVYAGIVPHHNIAHSLINGFYSSASQVNCYDLILIISPNHLSLGPRFQVSLKDYTTFDRVVYTDQVTAKALIDNKTVFEVWDQVIEKEHGQLVQMPYAGHYFPGTPVVSVMINETRSYAGIEAFRDKIISVLENKRVLIVGSIDFSHYLTLEDANDKDVFTRSKLEIDDTRGIISLSNDYIDSPSSYALLIELLHKERENDVLINYKTRIVDNTNSALILNSPKWAETTSYFSLLYIRD